MPKQWRVLRMMWVGKQQLIWSYFIASQAEPLLVSRSTGAFWRTWNTHTPIQQYGIEVDWPAFEWIKKSSTPARNSRGGSNHTINKWTNRNLWWFNFHLVNPVLWTRLTKDNSRPFHCLHLSWAEWACISMTGFPCLVIVTQVSQITPTAKSMHSDSNTPTLRSTY